jgi:hypothetical protein
MANQRYGLKEVANVIFFDTITGKPVVFFDTLKVSTIENASESAEATGGQGNNRLMSWDFGRTATLTLQDALLSDVSLSLLSGNAIKEANVQVVGREVLTVATLKVTLQNTPDVGSVTVYKMEGSIMGTEVTGFTVASAPSKEITFITGVANNDKVMVFYTYTLATGASQITFSGNSFPATYKVVGDTVVRGEDGVNRKMQFIIPKAKLQSNFSLTMDAENVATFDFTLDVLLDTATQKLYDIVRVN